jgi:hypothetical protein
MTTTIRSRRVRRLLWLHAQVKRQALRAVRATARAALLGRRVKALRLEVWALEQSLDAAQRAELEQARACPALTSPAPSPFRVQRPWARPRAAR